MSAMSVALSRVRSRRRRPWPKKRLVYHALCVVTCLAFVLVSILMFLRGDGWTILIPASLWAWFYTFERKRFRQALKAAENDRPLPPVRWWEWGWIVWCWLDLVWILVTLP